MVISFDVPNWAYPWVLVFAWQATTQLFFGIGVSFEGHLAGVMAGWLCTFAVFCYLPFKSLKNCFSKGVDFSIQTYNSDSLCQMNISPISVYDSVKIL